MRSFCLILASLFLAAFCSNAVFARFDEENDLLLSSAQFSLQEYRNEAEKLARWCDENGLLSHAKMTRDYILPILPDCLHIPMIPRKKQRDLLPEEASPEIVYWHNNWMVLRQNLSLKLQEHAKQALHERRVILAMQMIHIALHADPDNEKLRNVVGFEFYEGEWRTEWEINQMKRGRVNHERFGWIAARNIERYEAGERYDAKLKKWISKAEDDQRHATIENGWVISTEHYDIQTNHSIEEGVRLSRHLEVFYYVWKQVFIQYTASTSELAQWLDGQKARYKEPRLKFVFFKNRRDYVEALQKDDPIVEKSLGFYDEPTKTCYFFMYDVSNSEKDAEAEQNMLRTVFHEGTHQLFCCAKPVKYHARNNFWATEAVAIYMETLRREGNYFVLGNPMDVRVLAAKYRFFESKFYMPFENIVKLDARTFQNAPYLKELYSQCGGMGYFLMHYDKGSYRDAFVTYLNEIYMGRTNPQTLFQLLGESPDQLDSRYEKMLADIPVEFETESKNTGEK